MVAREDLQAFIEAYARGVGLETPSSVPARPAALDELQGEGEDVSTAVGKMVAEMPLQGFAAPPPPDEEERLRAMWTAGLFESETESKAVLDRIYRLAARLLPPDCTVFLSIVGDEDQSIVRGPESGPIHQGAITPRNTSFCSHTLLSKEGLDIPDATRDWRFSQSPWVREGIIKAYAGVPVVLEKRESPPGSESGDASSSTSSSKTHKVGSLCIVSSQPHPGGPFMDEDSTAILRDLAATVSHELTTQGELNLRKKELRMRECLASYYDRSNTRKRSNSSAYADKRLFDDLVASVRDIVSHCDTVTLVDMRDVDLTQEPAGMAVAGFSSSLLTRERFMDLLNQGRTSDVAKVIEVFRSERADGVFNSPDDIAKSPLRPFVRPTTQCTAIIPLFSPDGELMLLFTASSPVPHSAFSADDVLFFQTIGKIAVSSLLRERLLQADSAKTQFVARISHELRTPLYGLLSQLELIRDVLSPDVFHQIKDQLDTADICAHTLSDVVEDVLDFGAISSAGDAENALAKTKRKEKIDMEATALELVKVALLRQRQLESTRGAETIIKPTHLQVFLEVEVLSGGWKATLDAAGFKRVLLNLLTNSLKFTDAGSIIVSLKLVDDNKAVELAVIDTGRGMSKEFLRQGFRPFVQEREFSHGSGLGMTICMALIQRAGGHLKVDSKEGVGTTVRVVLPLSLETPPAQTIKPRPFNRRNLSSAALDFRRPSSAPPSTVFDGPHFAGRRPSLPDTYGSDTAILAPSRLTARRGLSESRAVLNGFSPITTSIPAPTTNGRAKESKMNVYEGATLLAGGEAKPVLSDSAASLAMHMHSISPSPTSLPSTPLMSSEASGFKSSGAELRVVAVDDNPIGLSILDRSLRKAQSKSTVNVTWRTASSGQGALDHYMHFRPQLVFTDISMPGMSDFQLADYIRQFEREHMIMPARIVAITANTQADKSPAIDYWIVKTGNVPLQVVAHVNEVEAELLSAHIASLSLATHVTPLGTPTRIVTDDVPLMAP